MSVVGIDFGNLNTVVAVARNRGIDVITNETSNRATPSLVSFGEKQRFLGEGAKTLEISNFKNTVSGLKRLSGRPINDPEVALNEKPFINARLVEGDRQEVAASVNFQGDQKEFTMTQISTMFLGKVKQFTSAELGIPVSDCVISCPTWFTDVQRRALLDAAQVSGLNCLRLMNDTTAIALGYGITKTDLPDSADEKHKPRIVTFVDIGHSSYQVAIASFVKGKLTVLGTACDRNLGGRDFDQAIVEHYIKEFDKKYKLDIKSSAKAIFRLRVGAEKVKKILSANTVAPYNVESLLDDKDVSAMVNRSDFEELCAPLVARLIPPLTAALGKAGLNPEQVDFVELVGGTSRIPIIKETLAKFFGGSLGGANKLSTTLNQDEAVARGCAFQCAILSPVLKVRDFTVQDQNTHAIELVWDGAQLPDPKKGEKQITAMEAFTANNVIPSSKMLTFYRALRNKELGKSGSVSFKLRAEYSEDPSIPSGTAKHIAEWTIGGIKKFPSTIFKEGDKELYSKGTLKVKAKLDGNGLIALESAFQSEDVVVPSEETAKVEVEGDVATESIEESSADGKVKTKKIVKRHELTIESVTSSASAELIAAWLALEGGMASNDRLVVDTAEKRNSLEEYVYDTRSKVSDQWAEFVDEQTKQSFLSELNATEDWLYGDGEDALKSAYIERLVHLKKVGDPIYNRFLDAEERPVAEKELSEYINNVLLDITAEDERYAHIAADELKSVEDSCRKKLDWLHESIGKQNEVPKYVKSVITASMIRQEKSALQTSVHAVTSKPKPKPVAVSKDEPKEEEKTADDSMDVEDGPPLEEVPADEKVEGMELD